MTVRVSPQRGSSDQIDGADEVVRQHAERCFPTDFVGIVRPFLQHILRPSLRAWCGLGCGYTAPAALASSSYTWGPQAERQVVA